MGMDMARDFIHNAHPRVGFQHDTNGRKCTGSLNPNGPTDVAVLHHYKFKSNKEYVQKRSRGRGSGSKVDVDKLINDAKESLKNALHKQKGQGIDDPSINKIFDDTAWKVMKKYVPKYAFFDEM